MEKCIAILHNDNCDIYWKFCAFLLHSDTIREKNSISLPVAGVLMSATMNHNINI